MESPFESPLAGNEADVLEVFGYSLVLYNDDEHTFDHVINALTSVCCLSVIQAEQCALLAHCHGKCRVKQGSYESLLPMHVALQTEYQLTTELVQ